MWLTGLVAPRHVGSSQTRARTRVPCIGRQTLNHCTIREALSEGFKVRTVSAGSPQARGRTRPRLWGSVGVRARHPAPGCREGCSRCAVGGAEFPAQSACALSHHPLLWPLPCPAATWGRRHSGAPQGHTGSKASQVSRSHETSLTLQLLRCPQHLGWS